MEKLITYILTILKKELSTSLTYHGIHHTLDVLKVCEEYIKIYHVDEYDANLLKTAAVLHDIGFVFHFEDHEEIGAQFAREILPDWGFRKEEIDQICGMIMSTKIPQNPKNLLEEIMCDADLDYLGTEKFESTGETLYQELLALNKIKDIKEWNVFQLRFLENHMFHTNFGKLYREPKKQSHLANLRKKS
ncbi:MAG: HD domain-containing protein [Saprospiraceae bacterium]